MNNFNYYKIFLTELINVLNDKYFNSVDIHIIHNNIYKQISLKQPGKTISLIFDTKDINGNYSIASLYVNDVKFNEFNIIEEHLFYQFLEMTFKTEINI
jgi:hypothetical protein